MADDKVWVQLYIGEKKSGEDPFQVRVAVNSNIDDLKEAAYDKCAKSLAHCEARQLVVYKHGTDLENLKEGDKLKPGKAVPPGTTDDNPLCVVAPENQPQGKNFMMLSFRLGMGRNAVAITENEAFWIFFHLFIVEFIQIVLC